MSRRPIGISLGNPTGIGPEVVVRALAARPQLDVRVFGDAGVLQRAAQVTGVEAPRAERVQAITALQEHEALPDSHRWPAAAPAFLPGGSRRCRAGGRDRRAGHGADLQGLGSRAPGSPTPGTPSIWPRAGVTDFAMMLAGPKLRVVLATTHVALRDVAALIDPDTIARAIILAARALRHHSASPTRASRSRG